MCTQGVKLPSVTNSIGMELLEISKANLKMCHDTSDAMAFTTLTKPFGLGKTGVTQGQWQSVMGTEPWTGQKNVQADKDYPATYVRWGDATEFCKSLTDLERAAGTLKADEDYQLPTEAQWERACRAGTPTAFSFGDDKAKLGEYAWFDENTTVVDEQYAHKVGLKKPNPWGFYDMHGNVWEWCSDWYNGKLKRIAGVNPIGPGGGLYRVNRGGSWQDSPGVCRSADRYCCVPSCRNDSLGFRVARSQSAQ